MKNVTDGNLQRSNRWYVSGADKNLTIKGIKGFGYNVVFQKPKRLEGRYTFVLRKRGHFGFSTGRSYRGASASEQHMIESAMGIAQRLARGTSG